VRIEELSRERVDRHAVDREIAPAGRLRVVEARVELHHEAAMAAAGFRVAARDREVGVDSFDAKDAEGSADGDDLAEAAERSFEAFEAQTVHFEIKVFRGVTEESVASVAAHKQRPAAGLADLLGDGQDLRIARAEISRRRHECRCNALVRSAPRDA
jgi:hypothetical protein